MTSAIQLGEVATFVRGVSFKPEDVTTIGTSGTVGCMRTKNVQSEIELSDVWAIPLEFVKREEQLLQEGDLLVSTANSWNLVGKCCWVPKLPWKSTLGGFISLLRADPERLNRRYLFHWFSSDRVQAQVRACGRQTTNISNLDIDRCLTLKIPLPPVIDQVRIAAILDKADELRTKRRHARAQFDLLSESIFTAAFGDPVSNSKKWPTAKLAEAVDGKYGVKAGPFGSSLKKEDYTIGGYRVYGQEQVLAGRFDIGDYYIDERKFRQLESCEVLAGDVLISLVGSFGKILVVPPGIERGIINPRLLKITPRIDLIRPHFLAALLSHRSVQREFERLSHGGTMGILNAGLVKELRVVLPPLDAQEHFELVLARVDHLLRKFKESTVQFDALFASLQHRAFRGDL